MRLAELLLFGALAGGLHLGAFALWAPDVPAGPNAPSGGENGESSVSLQAAPEQFATLIQAWQRPPQITARPVAAPAPPSETAPHRAELTPVAMPPPPQAPLPPRPVPMLPDIKILQPGPAVGATGPVVDAGALPPGVSAALNIPDAARPERHSSDRPAPAAPKSFDTAPQADLIDTAPPRASATAPTASLRPTPRPQNRTQQLAKRAPVPPQASAAAAQTRAAGTGSGRTASTKPTRAKPTPDTAPSVNAGAVRRLEAIWGAAIQSKVQRTARSPGGGPAQVTLRLQVAPSGQLLGARVVRSSGQPRADAAALSAAKRARRFKAAPKELRNASYTFQVVLRFK